MGHLRGPFDPQQVDELLCTCDWVPSLRFGVTQKDKLRPVDTQETAIPEGTDAIVCNIVACARTATTCNRHPEWSEAFDLEAAYKQCPVNPQHLPFVVVELDEPTSTGSSTAGQIRLFLSDALPFGSTASVIQINMLSAGVKKILRKLMDLIVSRARSRCLEQVPNIKQRVASSDVNAGNSTLDFVSCRCTCCCLKLA
eukprot:5977768-Amphidinium_carterae.1